MIKILHICAIFPPDIGGPAVQAADLVRWQRQSRSYEPFVITFGQKGKHSSSHAAPVYHLGKFLYLPGPLGTVARQGSAFLNILSVCLRIKPDVIHVHDLRVLGLVSGLIARLLGIPSIIKYSGDWVYESVNTRKLKAQIPQVYTTSLSARLLTYLQHFVLTLHRYVWVVSRYQQHILKCYLHIAPHRIVFLPNYMNLTSSPVIKRSLHQPLTILFAARPVPWKGLDQLPEFASHLADLPIHFLIAGSLSVPFHKQAFPPQHQLTLLGSIPPSRMSDLFAQADVFLSLSVYEPFGIALLEAQAAGLLVIAPQIGGIPEVVTDSVSGFLFPPADLRLAATKLKSWLKEPSLQKRLRSQASTSTQAFDFSHASKAIDRFYQHILRNK